MYGEARLYDPLQKKKTNKNKPSSTSLTSPSSSNPTNTIPARTAVFETNELLQLILSSAPASHLVNLRRVSRTWNTVVTSIGYALAPTHQHTDPVYPSMIFTPPPPVYTPAYSPATPLAFHPAITIKTKNAWLPWPHGESSKHQINVRVNCDFIAPALYAPDLRQQFLTDPPITQLYLKSYPTQHGSASAKLDLQDKGIRVWDFAEAMRKLRMSVGPLRCGEGCEGHLVAAFVVCRVKGRFEMVADRMWSMAERAIMLAHPGGATGQEYHEWWEEVNGPEL